MCYKYDCHSCCCCDKSPKHDIEIEIQSKTESVKEKNEVDSDTTTSDHEETQNEDLNPKITWTVEDFSEHNSELQNENDEPYTEPQSHEIKSGGQNQLPSRTKSMPSKSREIKRSNFKSMTLGSDRQHSLSVGRLDTSASLISLENIFVTDFKQTAV